ncbi:glycosyltransferase [Mesoflavibacter zeaxanthinifaciens]|uniref:glycosyltransferase n=1 Tax=Mesoflavibacter zeaxanthinifaciens TaxID=393060 RepID=UPI003A8F6D9A
MKVLFFLINMNLGGTEKSFLNLLSELPDCYSVDLLLLENSGELLQEIPDHVNVKILENNKEINEFLILGNRGFAFKELKRGLIFSFLKNILVWVGLKFNLIKHPFYGISGYINGVDKVYNHAVAFAGVHNFIAYYTLQHIKAKKKYLWIHFDVNNVIPTPNFGDKFYPTFDRIMCVSENAKAAFVEMFPKLKLRTKVFENIVSSNLLMEKANESISFTDEFVGCRIVTLGRLSKEKGQLMIPTVVSRLKNDGFDFKWYIIGDGKLKQSIEEKINEFNIENELIMLGAQLNPYPFLKDTDLYVQTSLHEGYCITLHEAKVFKKPVVTTNFLSAPNLIADGEDGLIVDISEEGIYEGVKRLLRDEDLINKFSRSILIKETSKEKVVDLFEL